MAKKSTPFPSPAKAKSNLDAVVKRIEQKTGPLPKMPEALLNKPSMNTVNPSVIASVRDRAKDAVRSVGSGPSMGKTMPAPKNYGGITAQPMPYYPGKTPGKVENMPYTPPKDGSGPKIENMPFKPTAPKDAVKPPPPGPFYPPKKEAPTPKPTYTGRPKPTPTPIPVPKKESRVIE
jgi:hypothetical protein